MTTINQIMSSVVPVPFREVQFTSNKKTATSINKVAPEKVVLPLSDSELDTFYRAISMAKSKPAI